MQSYLSPFAPIIATRGGLAAGQGGYEGRRAMLQLSGREEGEEEEGRKKEMEPKLCRLDWAIYVYKRVMR